MPLACSAPKLPMTPPAPFQRPVPRSSPTSTIRRPRPLSSSAQTCRLRCAQPAEVPRVVAQGARSALFPPERKTRLGGRVLNIGKLSSGAAEYYIGEVATAAEDYYTGHG